MIKIKIELKTDLCASNGMSAGNSLDNDLCFDSYGLPVIPGRRLKGILRQGAQFLQENRMLSAEDVTAIFGSNLGAEGGIAIGNAELENAQGIKAAIQKQKNDPGFSPTSIIRLFTYTKGQTAMVNGVADEQTLRYTRVLSMFDPVNNAPLVFYAPVETADPCFAEKLGLCCQSVRHIGLMRNRGLGWVKLSLEGECESSEKSYVPIGTGNDEHVIAYTVALDSSIVLPGCSEQLTAIPGRSIVGCIASAYILKYGCSDPGNDTSFCDLFLNGKAKWSDLTPVIDGKRSEPAPLMLVEIKNNASIVNRFNSSPDGKQKSVEGMFAVRSRDGYCIASVEKETTAHFSHATNKRAKQLYYRSSVSSRLLYSGEVILPAKYIERISALLIPGAGLRLGGSKSAQYSECRITAANNKAFHTTAINVHKGESVFAVLASDLLFFSDGMPVLDNSEIREKLCSVIGDAVSAYEPRFIDYVTYHTIGGYNAMWHLQKQQRTVVSGGSVFCLTVTKDAQLPSELYVGEYLQEGFGHIRIISSAEMGRLSDNKNRKCTVDSDSSKGTADQAFIEAVERLYEKENVSQRALNIYESIKDSGDLAGLVYGRIRLMTEQAASIQDLENRINAIKRDAARESAKFLFKNVFVERDCANWRELMLAVLHFYNYDKETRNGGKNG